MPLDRPSLTTIIERVQEDIDAFVPGKGAKILRTIVSALGRALAGVSNALYHYSEALFREALPDKADEAGLSRWASILQVPRGTAQPAAGNLTVTVSVNQTVPAETILVAGTERYRVTGDTAVTGPTDSVYVQALRGGEAGNLPPGAIVQFESPLPGIAPEATVVFPGLEGGYDEEGLEDWRADVLLRFSSPPGTGTRADYERWAREVSGVWKAWASVGDTLGSIRVWVVEEGTGVDITPPPELLTAVHDYIANDLKPEPVHTFEVVAPIALPASFTIAIEPDTPDNRDALEESLASYLLLVMDPRGYTIKLSRLERLGGPGLEAVTITSPASDIVVPVGSVVVLGPITWA